MVADGLHGGPGTSGVKSDGSVNQKSPTDPEALNANPTVNSVNQRTGEVSYTQNTGQGQ